MKFSCERAKQLYYAYSHDDEAGHVNGLGWAGLYLGRDHASGCEILTYDKDTAFMELTYVSEEEMETVWKALCDRLELSGEPEPEDIVVEQEREDIFVVSPDNRKFESKWLALNWIGEEYGYEHPPIWFRNRRNVFVLISEEEFETFLRDL